MLEPMHHFQPLCHQVHVAYLWSPGELPSEPEWVGCRFGLWAINKYPLYHLKCKLTMNEVRMRLEYTEGVNPIIRGSSVTAVRLRWLLHFY